MRDLFARYFRGFKDFCENGGAYNDDPFLYLFPGYLFAGLASFFNLVLIGMEKEYTIFPGILFSVFVLAIPPLLPFMVVKIRRLLLRARLRWIRFSRKNSPAFDEIADTIEKALAYSKKKVPFEFYQKNKEHNRRILEIVRTVSDIDWNAAVEANDLDLGHSDEIIRDLEDAIEKQTKARKSLDKEIPAVL